MGVENRRTPFAPRRGDVATGAAVGDPLTGIESKPEEPQLAFARYAIAFHVAARRSHAAHPVVEGSLEERALRSYEDDMLLHVHRDDAPFTTRVVGGNRQATVSFPPEVTFMSEGRIKRLSHGENGPRVRRFSLTCAETIFPQSDDEGGPLGVLTVVLLPESPNAPESELNEYDVIKLVKLWEGGERVVDEAELAQLWSPHGQPRETTLNALVREMFAQQWIPVPAKDDLTCDKETGRRGFRVGTVELALPDADAASLFEDLEALQRDRSAPEDGTERWNRAVAIGGILQGLLDFRAIESDELADVFADVEVDAKAHQLRAFHKGTLLSLSTVDTDTDADPEKGKRASPIGVDPYLAVPNIVLLHNEQRLKAARLKERKLSGEQHRPSFPHVLKPAAIRTTETGLREMARLQSQTLPNVFHYSSERKLQDSGGKSRGLDDLAAFVELRIHDLTSVLESRARRRDRWTAIVGIIVGAITAFLVKAWIEGSDWWVIVIVLGVFLGFLWVRDRLF
jgi:hypothetical protein